jgi:hypothetical protein
MQASLVAPMTTKETSKKVPFYFYAMQLLLGPNRSTVSALSTAACIFHMQARNQAQKKTVSCCGMTTRAAVNVWKTVRCCMYTLSHAEVRSAAQQRWSCCTYLVLLECFRERLPYISCLLQNLQEGSCLVPGSIRR